MLVEVATAERRAAERYSGVHDERSDNAGAAGEPYEGGERHPVASELDNRAG